MKPTATPRVLLPLAALLVLANPVAAYEESDAPLLDPQVVRVWHSPDQPEPGAQWTGGIEFVPGHNVTEVRFQVCNVGEFCVAPPTLAQRLGDNEWTYDTNDYRDPLGNPVPWGDEDATDGADWRVGTQFFLTHADGNHTELPHGLDLTSEECEGRYRECSETHYFAWDLPAGPVASAGETDRGAPGPAPLLVLGLLLLAAYPLRNRQGRS